MNLSRFVTVGENIHCTRIYQVGGKYCKAADEGYVIEYKSANGMAALPVPAVFTDGGDWENGKVKHCAVAIWQGKYGDGAGQAAGVDYLQSMAQRQEAAGADYLDINVDEFSTDVDERADLMQWTVRTVQEVVSIPVSLDSSNITILRAGLDAADSSRSKPMVNSVSLERLDAVEAAKEFTAVVIASAAGEKGLPATNEERLANVASLMINLRGAGLEDTDIHVDPLVFPVSVDPQNPKRFLDAVTAIRQEYGPEIHIVAGLSNVSFGMPSRKLINQVFTYMAVEAGADGGIVDPFQINLSILRGLDTSTEPYELARALLNGEDDFGMDFITASRAGKL